MNKIAFCIRKDWQQHHGGDVVQMLSTKRALETQYGMEIQIFSTPDELAKWQPQIVHIFNMQTFDESQRFLEAANSINAKKVLSTIYWNLEHSFYIDVISKAGIYPGSRVVKYGKPVFDIAMAGCAKILGKPYSLTNAYKAKMAAFLSQFDMLLPNSKEEGDIICQKFGVNIPAVTVVNAVDIQRFSFSGNTARKGVLSVGRIEPVKNQLSIIEALKKDTDIPIRVVGGVSENNRSYANNVHRQAKERGHVDIISTNQPQETLVDYYRTCKVHVLPSFRESPGLSSLEAMSVGANLVVSDAIFCPVETYFSSYVGRNIFVCDPYSPKSIRSAIKTALHAESVKQSINSCSWALAAQQTIVAYRKAACGNIY